MIKFLNDKNSVLFLQKRNRLTDIENKLRVTNGERAGGGVNQKSGMSRHTLLHVRAMTERGLLYSTGNCVQYLGKESRKEHLCTRLTVLSAETNGLVNQLHSDYRRGTVTPQWTAPQHHLKIPFSSLARSSHYLDFGV